MLPHSLDENVQSCEQKAGFKVADRRSFPQKKVKVSKILCSSYMPPESHPFARSSSMKNAK